MEKKLILVVDDEQGIRDIIKEYLVPEVQWTRKWTG